MPNSSSEPSKPYCSWAGKKLPVFYVALSVLSIMSSSTSSGSFLSYATSSMSSMSSSISFVFSTSSVSFSYAISEGQIIILHGVLLILILEASARPRLVFCSLLLILFEVLPHVVP
jgi:hypothetical protein